MNFRKTLLTVAFMAVCGFYGSAQAQLNTDIYGLRNQANSDFQSIASFVNGPFVNSLGFFTSLGWDNTPSVYDLMSIPGPHFSLSVGAGADFIPLPNLNNLTGLNVVSASSNFSLPSGVPLPFPVVTVRMGLFQGMDAGFRYTTIPSVSVGGVGGTFTGWGLDLRYKLFDGGELPTVTLVTSFDSMTGNVSISTGNINQTGINYTAPNGDNYPNASLTGSSIYALNWNTQSVGAMVMIGKSTVILYPFAGVGFQRNSGTITSSLNGSYTANLGDGSTPLTINPSGVSAGTPVVLEPKFEAGLNFGAGLGINWMVMAESNGTDLAASTSFLLAF